MPAVHLPAGQTRSNITSTPAPADPLGHPLHITIAVAAFLLVIALRCTPKFRRHVESTRRAPGLADQKSRHQRYQPAGTWEKSRGVSRTMGTVMSPNQESAATAFGRADDGHEHHGGDDVTRSSAEKEEPREDGSHVHAADMSSGQQQQHLRSRPPLTPPTLSAKTLALEERRLSAALSTTGDLHSSFFHQPDPDHSAHPPFSSSTVLPKTDSPSTPRRRSYTKALPLGPPQPVSFLEEDGTITPFSPSSFPSSSPILPLAPHDAFHATNADMEGEMTSAMDDSGADWRRHTRVYGGGVCLACLASGGEGGFYGDRVRPEEKR